MGEQLDYEATKAALRAQLAARSERGSLFASTAWKWYGAATSVVVVTCAVILTVWVTTGSQSSFVMVPSGGHGGSATGAHTSAPKVVDPVPVPGTPGLIAQTAVIEADGSITGLDIAGNVVTIATPTAEQTAVVQKYSRGRTAAEETEVRAVIATATAAAPPRRTPRPTPPPATGGGSTGGGSTGGSSTPPTVPTSNPPVVVVPDPTTENPPPPPPPPVTTQPPTQDPTPTTGTDPGTGGGSADPTTDNNVSVSDPT